MFPFTALSKLLRIEYPIIQAPMAGAVTGPELIAAVSNAGGLGTFAGAMLPPEAIREGVAQVRKKTNKPIGINLFVLEEPSPDPRQIARALELLQPIRDALGMPPGGPLQKYCEDTHAQFDVLLELAPAAASFTFGVLPEEKVAALKQRGTAVIGTATNVAEAVAWEQAGADAICAQGSEAGAHRGTFLGDFDSSLIGLIALVPQLVDAVRIPVIATGGIMDGRGIAAALMLGAAGVQLGTAFMTCPESGLAAPWKASLLHASGEQTRVSRIYSGKPARGIVNEFMRRMEPVQGEIPPYPIQNALTGPIRRAAAQANRPEYMSLWAGQGVGKCRELPAAEFVATLVAETQAALRSASQRSNG
jgi:nitronate monooxygenase